MKIQSIVAQHNSWDDRSTATVNLVDDDGTTISLKLPPTIVDQLFATATAHVKKTAQQQSVNFFNGMKDVGLPALEHQV